MFNILGLYLCGWMFHWIICDTLLFIRSVFITFIYIMYTPSIYIYPILGYLWGLFSVIYLIQVKCMLIPMQI